MSAHAENVEIGTEKWGGVTATCPRCGHTEVTYKWSDESFDIAARRSIRQLADRNCDLLERRADQ